MPVPLHPIDRKILSVLQQDASAPLDAIAARVNSSRTPVWNRIKKLRDKKIIRHYTVILDPMALGLEACFFVLIRTNRHQAEWQRQFLKTIQIQPEVMEAHRLAGDIDYILKVRVKNALAYDAFYQKLIAQVEIYNVTALLSMEDIKSTTILPLFAAENSSTS